MAAELAEAEKEVKKLRENRQEVQAELRSKKAEIFARRKTVADEHQELTVRFWLYLFGLRSHSQNFAIARMRP